MSAFLCSPEHVGALARYAVMNGLDTRPAVQIIGALLAANVASLRARYPNCSPDVVGEWLGQDKDGNPCTVADYMHEAIDEYGREFILSGADMANVARCFAYQACECSSWDGSEVEQAVKAIQTHGERAGGPVRVTWTYDGREALKAE